MLQLLQKEQLFAEMLHSPSKAQMLHSHSKAQLMLQMLQREQLFTGIYQFFFKGTINGPVVAKGPTICMDASFTFKGIVYASVAVKGITLSMEQSLLPHTSPEGCSL